MRVEDEQVEGQTGRPPRPGRPQGVAPHRVAARPEPKAMPSASIIVDPTLQGHTTTPVELDKPRQSHLPVDAQSTETILLTPLPRVPRVPNSRNSIFKVAAVAGSALVAGALALNPWVLPEPHRASLEQWSTNAARALQSDMVQLTSGDEQVDKPAAVAPLVPTPQAPLSARPQLGQTEAGTETAASSARPSAAEAMAAPEAVRPEPAEAEAPAADSRRGQVDEAKKLVRKAQSYHASGRHRDAASHYRQAIKLVKHYARAQAGLARVLLEMNKPREAVRWARRAHRGRPGIKSYSDLLDRARNAVGATGRNPSMDVDAHAAVEAVVETATNE